MSQRVTSWPGRAPATTIRAAGVSAHRRWVEQERAGDRDAFAALYRLHAIPITRYVAGYLSSTSRVEDVVGQTFLLAWRDLPKLRQPERF